MNVEQVSLSGHTDTTQSICVKNVLYIQPVTTAVPRVGLGRSSVSTIPYCPRPLVSNRSSTRIGRPISCGNPLSSHSTAAPINAFSGMMQRQHRPSATEARFRPESQSERDAADADTAGDAEASKEVSKRDHWATLLTTMPNLSSR